MARQPEQLTTRPNFSSGDFGAPSQWEEFRYHHPMRGEIPGKVFLGKTLGLTGMEVSLNALPAGVEVPFLHAHHQNEELYVFLGGEGEYQVDGETIPLKAGSVLRVAPAGMRVWRATGTEPLTYLVVQARAGSLEQATGRDGILGEHPPVW